jgi:hypothetical protein
MARIRRKEVDESTTGTSAAPRSAGDTSAAAPERERIAARAYELYRARDEADGDAMEDWLAAERELARRRNNE